MFCKSWWYFLTYFIWWQYHSGIMKGDLEEKMTKHAIWVQIPDPQWKSRNNLLANGQWDLFEQTMYELWQFFHLNQTANFSTLNNIAWTLILLLSANFFISVCFLAWQWTKDMNFSINLHKNLFMFTFCGYLCTTI